MNTEITSRRLALNKAKGVSTFGTVSHQEMYE